MSVTLTAPRGRVGGAAFTGLEARLKTAGRVLTVEPLTFGVFGGHCSGSLSVDLGPSVPAFAGRVTIEGIDMAQVMAYAGKEGAMTGRLSGTIKVGGHGADAAGTIRALEGSGRVDVKNGTLPHLDLVGKVVRALGRPGEAPAGSGEAFETLGGSFILAGGVARSSDLAFESRDVDLDGTGRLSLGDGTVNVRANLRLSEELTRRMGRDGARLTSENGRMTVPAVLSGPIEAPGVAVDVNAMARRAAAEEAKKQIGRRLNELLKKPGGGGAR
jgi:AsmA protein